MSDIPDDILAAIDSLIDYTLEHGDEEGSFKEQVQDGDPTDHIYISLYKLMKSRGQDMTHYVDPDHIPDDWYAEP